MPEGLIAFILPNFNIFFLFFTFLFKTNYAVKANHIYSAWFITVNSAKMSQKKSIVKEYSNGEVTIVWKPNLCMHSRLCFNGLPEVFDPKARPWVNAEGAPSEQIVEQVKKCPSGALAFHYNDESKAPSVQEEDPKDATEAEVIPNGPLMVKGTIALKGKDGNVSTQEKLTAFCRCGASSNKPFCDGSHKEVEFEG